MKMAEGKKPFLKKLQEKDRAAKRKIMVWASAVSMVIVFAAWFEYFNSFVVPSSLSQSAAVSASGFSVWQTIRAGAAVVAHVAADAFGVVTNKFSAPNSYEVRP